jgi:2-polyprenyl-6-methoxyphenol hydroxylase-like FAD-dependent oxidoreductase
MDVTNGRSMEHFRRLGIGERVRDAGVPRENAMDVAWFTRLAEWEVARFHYPDVQSWRAAILAKNDGSQPLEPYMRMSQIILEPLLLEILRESPLVDIRYGVTLDAVSQTESGVVLDLRDSATQTQSQINCDLLAGCDGGSGRVRGELGIDWEGQWNIVPFYMIHYRTREKDKMRPTGLLWHYQSVPGGTLIAQDDDETYTLHNVLAPGIDGQAIDPKAFLFESLGVEFECEILQANPWSPHLVVAESYGRGRVWMGGDAVHQYIPSGGFGMNTGIGDAVDLGWKFAAYLQGWGGPRLLQSIDAERRPVGRTNRDQAGANMDVRFAIANEYERIGSVMHEDSAEGEAARGRFGARILELENAENSARGIELGYRYRNSPVICHEPGEPRWDALEYVPSTWPGVRAPHIFLANGEAIFDLFGPWFTLISFGENDISGFVAAASARGVPLEILAIDDAHAASIYERKLVLIRPDQHVAWRGNVEPAHPFTIIDHIRGASS